MIPTSLLHDVCPKCKGTGWIYYENEHGYMMGKICECGERERQIIRDKLDFAELPEAFKDIELSKLTLSAYRTPEAKEKVRKCAAVIKYYLDNFDTMLGEGMGLYIFGSVKGSGKTHMIAAIANEIIRKKRKSVKFATSLQILSEIKATWDIKDKAESKLLSDLSRVPVLIIDDFGTENVKDWVQERFYQIINERYMNRKITMFTSNYSLESIDYDERITNRIKERCYQLPFAEESLRENKAEDSRQMIEDILKGKVV